MVERKKITKYNNIVHHRCCNTSYTILYILKLGTFLEKETNIWDSGMYNIFSYHEGENIFPGKEFLLII